MLYFLIHLDSLQAFFNRIPCLRRTYFENEMRIFIMIGEANDRQTDRQTDRKKESSGFENGTIEYCEKFSPEQYLKEYYSSDQMWNTDMILARESWVWLNKLGRSFARAIDVGTGPVLEYPFMFAPFVTKYDLSDFVENNLASIRRWINFDHDAHNWNPIFRGVISSQGQNTDQMEIRTEKLRRSIGDLLSIDLRQSFPLGREVRYDLVTSFFCTECVDVTFRGWSECKQRLLNLVAPGGAFFSAIVQNCTHYRILDTWLPTCKLNPDDLTTFFSSAGFDAMIDSYSCPEFSDSGFSEFMIVKAIRQNS